MYENYTLFELVHILNKNSVQITCPWNKSSILKMISKQRILLPFKKGPMQLTKWNCYVQNSMAFDRQNMIYIPGTGFQLYQGCIFRFSDEIVYEIESIFESTSGNMYICLYNRTKKVLEKMLVKYFMKLLDYDDVTILQYRHGRYYMCREEEEFWEKRYGSWISI